MLMIIKTLEVVAVLIEVGRGRYVINIEAVNPYPRL